MSTPASRRTFLGASALAGAATWAGGQLYAADAPSSSGPNETINIGVIGCGKRGTQVTRLMVGVPGTRIVAICDPSEERRGKFQTKFGGEKTAAYGDFRKLCDDKNVDVVLVATPGHWHVLPLLEACRAGKDVYVEKPLSKTVEEGQAAVEAAKKYNRIVQIGTQQANWPHYQKAAEIVQSGRLGTITEVKCWDMDYYYPGYGSPADSSPPEGLDWDMFVGPAPKVPYNYNRENHHYWFFDYGGGWQIDWAVHHYQVIQWYMQVHGPISAVGVGSRYAMKDNCEWPDTFSAICEYPTCPQAPKGFLLQYTFRSCSRGEQRSHAKKFFGTDATMIVDRSGYTLYAEARNGKKLGQVLESDRSPMDRHAEAFFEAVRNRKKPFADVEMGHLATIPGLLMNISWKVGRRIHWNPETQQVVGDTEANQLTHAAMHNGWKLEV